jgi:hypothetical protein
MTFEEFEQLPDQKFGHYELRHGTVPLFFGSALPVEAIFE